MRAPTVRQLSSVQRLFQQAAACQRTGRLQEADMLCRHILAGAPAHHESINLLGEIAAMSGRDDAALALFTDAVGLKPSEPRYQYNLGTFLLKADRFEEAARCFRKAVQKKPDFALAHGNLGAALAKLGQLRQAVAGYRTAVRLDRTYAQAYINLGHALRLLGDFQEAVAAFREALRLTPQANHLRIYLNDALMESGMPAEALAICREAVHIDPGDMKARQTLSHALLRAGMLLEGWDEHEARWRVEGSGSPFPSLPSWDGAPAGDRRILLYSEQGLGDTLQFCRFVPRLAERGRIVLSVQPGLVRLLADLPGIEQIIGTDRQPPAFDMHLPLMSAPRVLGTTLETIPATVPYLQADPRAANAWRRLLRTLQGFKVGLVWAGNPKHKGDSRRSLSLAQLAPLADVPGVTFVSLQKGPAGALIQTVPEWAAMEDWTDALGDFADTAALVEALDLVIGVDTSTIHLAGALSKPVWMLNRYDTDWRWLLDRDDSPWYPTLRLFRQSRVDQWGPAIQALRVALVQFAADHHDDATLPDAPSEDTTPMLLQSADRLLHRAAAEREAGRSARAERLCHHALILAPGHAGSRQLLDALAP